MRNIINFEDAHNSNEILEEIRRNIEIENRLRESKNKINTNIEIFVNSFVFDDTTIDGYLSLTDTKLICQNDDLLKDHYVDGLAMSEVIAKFRQSKYYKNIPDRYGKANGTDWGDGYDFKLKHYINNHYFVDIINKKIYFCHKENINYRLNFSEKTLIISISESYKRMSYYQDPKGDRPYPTTHENKYSYIVVELQIDLTTNTIKKIKSEENGD